MAKLESKKNGRKKNDLSINKRRKHKMQTKGSSTKGKVPNKKHVNVKLEKKSKTNKKVILDTDNKIRKPKDSGRVLRKNNNNKKTESGFTGQKKVLGKKNLKSNTQKDSSFKLQSKTKKKVMKGLNHRMKLTKKNKNQSIGSSTKKTRKYEHKDELLMKKYEAIKKRNTEIENQISEEVSDPTLLINMEMVHQAVSGIRKLAALGEKSSKNLLDDISGDDGLIFMQVSICKMPNVVKDQHLVKPMTIKVSLPNSLVNDETEIILITRDLERGIRRDHEPSLHFYQELLQQHNATSLVSEVIPLRQLKVEYREFEAKRKLSSRVDVVLCDDTVIRFIPKFLGKHFYQKKKIPVQVNLKTKNLEKEIKRALSVSQLTFTMRGNCALMKVGRLSLTDEEIVENILAVVQKLASHVPGKWKNVQNLSLKLISSQSIPFFIRMSSLNDVGVVHSRQRFTKEPISGTLTTYPRKCVTVYPDGTVTLQSLTKIRERIPIEERKDTKKTKKQLKKLQKIKTKEEEKPGTGKIMEVQRNQASSTEEECAKRTGEDDQESKAKKQKVESASETSEPKKAKKQKVSKKDDSDTDEEELEAQELDYLKKRSEEQEAEGRTSMEEEEDSEADDSDPWDEGSDDDVLGSDDEEL